MAPLNRRRFLTKSGIGLLPALVPFGSVLASDKEQKGIPPPATPVVKFYGDGEMFEPADYLAELQNAQAAGLTGRDSYGRGGAIEHLEKKFAEITGKEKAIFMPTGTLANQLAIAVLSEENTKVFVQDTSHVYRDEGDAAQSTFGKRLYPLAKGETYFTAQQLQEVIETMPREEVFHSGFGAVSIENPVRRTLGQHVPLDEIKKISTYCRSKGIKLHLDGARLYMASAWTGVPIKEYSSYFDTVYISLYKYLGASAGAVLCGNKEVIDKMPHLMKVHGGAMYGNWTNAAMALQRLEGFEGRLQESVKRADQIIAALNKMPGVKIAAIPGGTNIYNFELSKNIDSKKLRDTLRKDHAIALPGFNQNNQAQLSINETLLYQTPDSIMSAFKKSLTA